MKPIILSSISVMIVLTLVALSGEKVPYTKRQQYTESYDKTPADVQFVPGSNLDIQADKDGNVGQGVWQADAQAVDGSGKVVEIVYPGQRRVSQKSVSCTLAEIKAGLTAAGVANPNVFLKQLQQGWLNAIEAKLPQ